MKQKPGGATGKFHLQPWKAFAAACCVNSLSAAPVAAQDLSAIMQQNMAFDQQFNQQLQSMQMQNQMQMQQLLQHYIHQHGPQLQQEYAQFIQSTGMQLSFEQFAYNHMATQGGRNPGPALAQQRRNFQASQDANRTVQEGYDSYNQGWHTNSQSMDNMNDRYSREAIQGNQYYQNSVTGEVTELQYGAPAGVYENNQGTYISTPNGEYEQVDPLGYGQRMEVMDPRYR